MRSGPAPEAARRLAADGRAALGAPSLGRRALAAVAPVAAAWTRFTLARESWQYPRRKRRAYRVSRWALRSGAIGSLEVSVERALKRTRVDLAGARDGPSARQLARGIYNAGTLGCRSGIYMKTNELRGMNRSNGDTFSLTTALG